MSRILPILFNSEMVRAILDGRKMVTRRLVMPHNRKKAKEQGYCQGAGLWVDPSTDNGDREGHIKDYSVSSCWMSYNWYINRYAPYQPGDILYVRETWAQTTDLFGEFPEYIYRVDYTGDAKWRPSIHMPKEAARIWLKVTDVRVERLQEIDGEGCIAEGVELEALKEVGEEFARGMFHDIWDSAIKKADIGRYSWSANPWVWVIEFERCESPESEGV